MDPGGEGAVRRGARLRRGAAQPRADSHSYPKCRDGRKHPGSAAPYTGPLDPLRIIMYFQCSKAEIYCAKRVDFDKGTAPSHILIEQLPKRVHTGAFCVGKSDVGVAHKIS